MLMYISILLISTYSSVVSFVIRPEFSNSFVSAYQRYRFAPRENDESESRNAMAGHIDARRQNLDMNEDFIPSLDAFNLYLLKTGYGLDRGRPLGDRTSSGCRRTREQRIRYSPRFFTDKAEPCFEDNDLMASFNTQPVPDTGHAIFIPAHHPSELRSKEIRLYQKVIFQRLITLLNNYSMNRRTKNWDVQQKARMQDAMRDWYNDMRREDASAALSGTFPQIERR